MSESTKIILTAEDRTSAAFASVGRNIDKLGASAAAVGISFAALAAGAVAAMAAFGSLTQKAAEFKDLEEKTGATAEGLASLAVSAAVGGAAMESVAAFSIKLTKNLTGVDDESKAAGAAIKALGLDLEKFKDADPTDRMEMLAKALDQFSDGTGKTAVMEALAKGGAQLLPMMKELAQEGGRQVILTQQMIEQADAYADKQAKTSATLSIYAQAIATQALPALTSFTGALADTAKEMLALDNKASGLAGNTAVRDFAISAAKALGFVVDAADGAWRAVSIVGKTIGAVAAAAAAVIRGEFSVANSVFDQWKTEVDATLSRGMFSDKLQARLAELNSGATSAAASAKKPKLNFGGAVKPEKAGKATTEKDQIDDSARALAAYVKQLDSTIQKEDELTEVQRARIFLLSLGVTGEVDQVRELVLGMAQRIDKEKALNEVLKQRQKWEAMTPSGRLEAQRKDLADLQDWLFPMGADGSRSPLDSGATDKFNEIASSILGIGEAAKESRSLMDELGATFSSAFEDAIVGGKGLSDVLKGLEKDIIRIITRKLVTEPFSEFIGGAIKSIFPFEGGGVMTSGGPVPLRKYASGGVASSPQLAMFGEGSQPEAYVPLPDGRRIPVALKGRGGSPMNNVNISFTLAAPADRRTQAQIATLAGQGVQRALARNT